MCWGVGISGVFGLVLPHWCSLVLVLSVAVLVLVLDDATTLEYRVFRENSEVARGFVLPIGG